MIGDRTVAPVAKAVAFVRDHSAGDCPIIKMIGDRTVAPVAKAVAFVRDHSAAVSRSIELLSTDSDYYLVIPDFNDPPASMKIPSKFLRYFLIAALLLIAGITFVILQTAMTHPSLAPLDPAALQARAEYHRSTLVPYMAGVFPRLLFANAGVALLILMVPLFWVWVWWFRRDLPDLVVRFMQATVCILMIALGYNSFSRAYLTYRLLSWQMIAPMYLPHGWLEMLAFVLAGTSAFLCIDALKTYLLENGNSPDLHPGDICLFILGRTWKAGLVIFILMAVAAAIECWVTPVLVESAFTAALQRA